jgi:Tfp pilus assembly protein PilO
VNRKILLAAALAAVVVAVGWYTFLWKPTSAHLQATRAAAVASQDQLGSLRSRAAALEAERRRIPEEETKVAALEASVPRSPEVAPALRELASIERASGVLIQSESQSLPTSSTGTGTSGAASSAPVLDQVQLGLVVQGDYRQLMSFLGRLGRLPRATVVQSVDISTGGGVQSGPGALTATVQALVFYDPTAPPSRPTLG